MLALMVLVPPVGAFILSQFHRSAHAVLAPILATDYGFTPETISLISGSFHLVFALLQIPLGIALDRYGPRRVIALCGVLAVLGAVLFSVAADAVTMMVAQGLIGAGCSPALMGSLVLAARWYPADRFAAVSGMVISVSMLGVIASATPLALVTETLGWRAAYWGMAGLSAMLAALTLVMTRDAPDGHDFHDRQPESLCDVMSGVRQVLAAPVMWPVMAVAFTAYPSLLTIRGLWSGPYLQDVVGLSAVAAGNVLFVMTIMMAVFPGLYGQLAKRWGPRRLLGAGGLATAAVMACLALLTDPTLKTVAVLLALQGGIGCFAVLVYTQARSSFPDHLIGRSMTMVNLAVFTGIFIWQGVSGLIIGAYPAGAVAGYQLMFAVLAASVGIAGAGFALTIKKLSRMSEKRA